MRKFLVREGFVGDIPSPLTPVAAFDILDFLSSEIQASRMLLRKKAVEGVEDISDSERCGALISEMLQLLGAPSAEPKASLASMLSQLCAAVESQLAKVIACASPPICYIFTVSHSMSSVITGARRATWENDFGGQIM